MFLQFEAVQEYTKIVFILSQSNSERKTETSVWISFYEHSIYYLQAVEEKTDTETYRLEVAYQRSNSVRRRMAEEDESEGKSLIVADIRRRQWERGKSESEARSIGYNGDIGVYGRALSVTTNMRKVLYGVVPCD
nr:hypothetical protein Itr_chr11CG24330 [Ipomoea trifida]GMD57756.1 hypothetical protein Iba_chr11eCG15850 [Ipomoea batatas]